MINFLKDSGSFDQIHELAFLCALKLQFIFGEDPAAELPPPEMAEEEALALLTSRDPWDGKSALDTAAILGRSEIVQFFISKEVSLNDTSTKGAFA